MNDVAGMLCELNAPQILIRAAYFEHIQEISCAMPSCICPLGRGWFAEVGDEEHKRWAPSPDRWPIAGKDGGPYEVANVRLSHLACNQRASGLATAAITTYETRRKSMAVTKARHADRLFERSSRGGKKANCVRWNIKRGKPCTCGEHVSV